MTGNWQIIVALACVAGAVMLLTRRAWRLWKGRSAGCGSGCQSCPAGQATEERTAVKPLVTLNVSLRDRESD
jgi:FeoB-associated Cys-rich membrane protein